MTPEQLPSQVTLPETSGNSMKGWTFRVSWTNTGLTETINASTREVAERKLTRRYPGAISYEFRREVLPIPPDRWLESMPKKVF